VRSEGGEAERLPGRHAALAVVLAHHRPALMSQDDIRAGRLHQFWHLLPPSGGSGL
jgi:hypothetical protein